MFRALLARPQEARTNGTWYIACVLCQLAVPRFAAPTQTTSFRGAQAIFRAKHFHVQYPTFSTAVTLHTYSPMKMEQTECSKTLAFEIQTPVNHPEESIKHSEPVESLKSRIKSKTVL
jgi:hypothetical protein